MRIFPVPSLSLSSNGGARQSAAGFVAAALLIGVLPGAFAAAPAAAEAQPAEQKPAAIADCSLYRAKRDGVPVFKEAATTSEVLIRLKLGEKVCHIGEQGGFAIVDWARQAAANGSDQAASENAKPELRYVRLVELWEPREMRQTGFVDEMMLRLRDYYHYWRHGGVPDDVYGPFRPLTEPFFGEPRCEAGKLCEKMKKDKQ